MEVLDIVNSYFSVSSQALRVIGVRTRIQVGATCKMGSAQNYKKNYLNFNVLSSVTRKNIKWQESYFMVVL